jgi:hypothetical protein
MQKKCNQAHIELDIIKNKTKKAKEISYKKIL